MDWPAIEEIVYSESSHPKRILGGHRTKDGFLVQVFRPDAVQVSPFSSAYPNERSYLAIASPPSTRNRLSVTKPFL